MRSMDLYSIIACLLLLHTFYLASADEKIKVLLPGVATQSLDAYICTGYKLKDEDAFITKIEPLTNSSVAHHMFVHACERPSSNEAYWPGATACDGESAIIFGWGLNAPALTLPDNVGYKVGPSTRYRYIVIAIHYLNLVSNDHSGVELTITTKPRQYQAGIMLLVTGNIQIPPLTKKYSTTMSCEYNGPKLHVFACRVHAHARGVVNSGYRVRNETNWTELFIGDPQWPQTFYPTKSVFDVEKGDALVGSCTYQNNETRLIGAGSTHDDEMCNVYLMYYTEHRDQVGTYCAGSRYPGLEKTIPAEAMVRPMPPTGIKAVEHHHTTSSPPRPTQFKLVHNWYDSSNVKFGQIGAAWANQKDQSVYIFHRGSQTWQSENEFNYKKYSLIVENTIISLDMATGKVNKAFGSNQFYMPHGLRIDHNGNIWVTDVAKHQVIKFGPTNFNEPVLKVGEELVPGNDHNHLCKPADVAVLSNGDFYVADGYCNSRVVKFNKNGEFLTEWGSKGNKNPNTGDRFFVVHSLALHEEQNLLCVADRENARVQCFDLSGKFLFETNLKDYGPIYGIAFAANNGSTLYAVNLYTSKSESKVIKISTQTGQVIGSFDLDSSIQNPHALSVSDDASQIYVANLLNPSGVFKYSLGEYDEHSYHNDHQHHMSQNDSITSVIRQYRNLIIIIGAITILLTGILLWSIMLRLVRRCFNKLGNEDKEGFSRLRTESDDEDTQDLTVYNRAEFKTTSHRTLQEFKDYESNSDVETRLT